MSCPACPGGAVKTRIMTIRTICETLSQGHNILAGMYKELAAETKIQEDQILYLVQAEKHTHMGLESLKVVVPAEAQEVFEQKNEEANASRLSGPENNPSST